MSSRALASLAALGLAVVGCSGSAASPPDATTSDQTSAPPGSLDEGNVAAGDPSADDGVTPAGPATPAPEAGSDAASCSGSTPFRCSADGGSRAQCASGVPVTEACANGCLRHPSGTSSDDTCMGTTASWSCAGSYGTSKAANGDYDLTAFGCWIDAAGGAHGDAGDNCIPTCLSQAKAAGLCAAGDTGKSCEERVTWFTADAARFGCLARVRVTNPANGKSVVAVALDYGPSCSVEGKVDKAVLDASGRVDRELFGADEGVVDRAAVHVVEVDPSTPLGPVP